MSHTRRISIRACDFVVCDSGAGSPIVFIHGFPLDHTMWQAQLDKFSATHRVVAPDLRGFGGSSLTEGVVTMEQMADDVSQLLDALAVREPIVLCGLSMGGYVAFQFLRKYEPRVRALVLCDTRSAPDTPEAAANRHKTAQQALDEGAAPVAEAMLPRLVASDAAQRTPLVVEALRRMMLATDPRAIAAALRGMAARSDSTPILGAIRVPTLVLVGEHDAISPPSEMRQMAEAIPGAKFVVIPSAGHMAPMENPQAVNEAIAHFVAGL